MHSKILLWTCFEQHSYYVFFSFNLGNETFLVKRSLRECWNCRGAKSEDLIVAQVVKKQKVLPQYLMKPER
jgi:hypothetical protein